MKDIYTEFAQAFRDQAELGPEYDGEYDAIDAQFRVAEEEFWELTDDIDDYLQVLDSCEGTRVVPASAHHDRLAEEIADNLVTMHVLADMLGIDIREAYIKKMDYNMLKTTDKDDDGKVTDDADIEKPDYGDTHNE